MWVVKMVVDRYVGIVCMYNKSGIVGCMVNGWNMCVFVYKSGIVG